MRKIFWLLLFLFLFPIASAIVIIPPTIYFVTLSIATFIGNAIIGLLAWVAVTGIVNKKFFGKQVSEIFSHVFTGIKNITIAAISMIVALLLINPLEIYSILVGAVTASIICGLLMCVANYSKFRAVEKKEKTGILISNTVFSIIVLVLFALSASASLETRVLTQEPYSDSYDRSEIPILSIIGDVAKKTLAPMNDEFSQGISAPSYESDIEPLYDYIVEERKQIVLQEIWFQPMNLEECRLNIGNQSFSFTPQNNCYTIKNGFPERIICPVKISINEVNQKGTVKVTGGGSCIEDTLITIENGFLVDVQ